MRIVSAVCPSAGGLQLSLQASGRLFMRSDVWQRRASVEQGVDGRLCESDISSSSARELGFQGPYCCTCPV